MATKPIEEIFPETGTTAEQAESVQHAGAETRQFVIFLVADEVFAVDLAPVQEIIRLPDVVRVPMAPASLDGLANLRGRVLPIISLRRMFGFPEIEHSDSTRAVVIDVGQPLGFVVDKVSSVVGVESSRIESAEKFSGTIDTEMLAGLVKDVGTFPMVMVLDFAKVVQREFHHTNETSRKTEASLAATGESSESIDDAISEERQLVSFDVNDQEYAISIDEVQEIVQVPASIMHVPHSKAHVLGIMTLRNRLLPLMSLRRIFGLCERTLDEKSRIVVLSLGAASVGVVVDGVREVLRVTETDVGPMPPLLAREGDLADIAGICRLDDGKRLVSIVAAHKLFDHSSVKEALTNVKDMKQAGGEEETDQEDIDDVEQMVVFRLDKEEFGAPIGSVQEIVRVPEEMTRVHNAQAYVEGVINLRGTVLPVIDLRTRMGLERAQRSDRQRIMVFLMGETRTGFVVDQVAEVLRIPKNAIEPAPRLSGDQGTLLSRMANLEKVQRMIQLLDPHHLMENHQLGVVASAVG